LLGLDCNDFREAAANGHWLAYAGVHALHTPFFKKKLRCRVKLFLLLFHPLELTGHRPSGAPSIELRLHPSKVCSSWWSS